MVVALYVAQAPEIVIEDGVACVKAKSDSEQVCWHLPLREFRIAVRRAERVLVEHDARGDVVPFRREGG